ncbi:MAG: DUF11 domain-containing protein [Verrucomicrobiae bacterium]|nr:DUF11 domain-containing protein [Verrucomicrobiae bacterium]
MQVIRETSRACVVAGAGLRAVVTLGLIAGSVFGGLAQGIVQEFFVPMPEAQIRQYFLTLAPGTGSTIDSIVSVVTPVPGSRIVYDHWEDGYEIDLNAPAQPSTEVWGDGNDANGKPPGYASDPLGFPAGSVISLRNLVPLPRNPSALVFDGRDRIGASQAIVMSRSAWATAPGPLLADSVEVPSTFDYGTQFIIPVGQDVIFPSPLSASMFEQCALMIQAAQNGTVVLLDADANGSPEISVTLNRGESYLLPGGVRKGATVAASKPVQVQLLTGDIGANYESRWFTIPSLDVWGSEYYAPVGTASNGDSTYVFFFNPHPAPITINFTTRNGSGSFSIPASNTNVFLMPQNSGARFVNQGGQTFYGIATVGASPTRNNVHDWGYSLVPTVNLTTEMVVGWGPGSENLTQNGSPAWVAAIQATTLYVDYNGDRAGPLTDPLGGKYDVAYSVSPLEVIRIYEPDRDQTGLRVYTLDGTLVTGAWGQDPAVAGPALPFLDVGNTIQNFPLPVLSKSVRILPPGGPVPAIGDTVEYSITLENRGIIALSAVSVVDLPPATGLAYVPNSTTRDGSAIPDSASGTPFPLDEGLTIPILLRRSSTEIRYRMTIAATGQFKNVAVTSIPGVSTEHVLNVPGAVPTPCSLNFTDAGGGPTQYLAGSPVYVSLADPDANLNPAAPDTVVVYVENLVTGDVEPVTLTETGNATGMFRNLAPLPTSTTSGGLIGDGVLFVLPGNLISVRYTDPQFGDTCSATAGIFIASNLKQLYLMSDGSDGDATGALNRVDPVASGAASTLVTGLIPTSTSNVSFTTTGSTPWVVPAGVTLVTVKAWGAGGGGGGGGGTSGRTGGAGGGGGFAQANISVTPGESLTVGVGGGGSAGTHVTSSTSGTGGGGGGRSDLRRGSTVLIAAAGGGGGGGGDDQNTSGIPLGGPGGAGGGATGVAGTTGGGTSTGGGAGTSSAGGAGGGSSTTAGSTGSSLTGGAGGEAGTTGTSATGGALGGGVGGRTTSGRAGGGGGGGGHFGGGGGSAAGAASVSGAGGGGGSGLASGGTLASGSGQNAGNNADAAYADTAGRGGNGGALGANGQAGNPGRVVISYVTGNSVTFTQTPTFCSSFAMPSGQTVTIKAYYSMVSGTIGTAVGASLRYGATTFFSASSATTGSDANGTFLQWSGPLAGAVNIAAGQAITLEVTSNLPAGNSFRIQYGSSSKPSLISLPATTVITVTSLAVYDAPYPGGIPVPAAANGQTLYVRAEVSDPFGAYDITSLPFSIAGPPGFGGLSGTLTDASVVASTACSKTYQYLWQTGSIPGAYTVAVTAKEGLENAVTDQRSTTVSLSPLDLGTPCTSQFTGTDNGTPASSFAPNSPIWIRVTDLDQNLNSSAIESLAVTVSSTGGDSETVTLLETGPATGVFTGSVSSSTVLGVGVNNGTLFAPEGSLLTLTYVDPDDPLDPCSATAVIPGASGGPSGLIVKERLVPADGVALVGESVVYRLQVANVGNATATTVVLTDTFPPTHLQFVAASISPSSTSPAGTITWNNIGPIPAGGIANVTVEFLAIAAGFEVANSAAVSGGLIAGPASVPVDITDPRQQLTKVRLDPPSGVIAIGDLQSFRISVRNIGNTAIARLPLTDTFSMACWEYVTASPAPDAIGAGLILWEDLTGAGNLAVGESLSVDVTLRAVGNCDPAENIAAAEFSVDINGNPVPPVTSTADAVTRAAAISGFVFAEDDVPGFSPGDQPLPGVIVRLFQDPVGNGSPADWVLVDVTMTDANGYYEFLNLALGSYFVVEEDPFGYVSVADTAGPNDNLIPVKVVALKEYPGNNFLDDLARFTDIGMIALEKAASPWVYTAAGQTITYTFTVTNPGTVPLSSVMVGDSKTSPPVYQSGDTNNDGRLDVNETWIFTASYQITTADVAAGTLLNVAKVVGSDPYGRSVGDTDDATVQLGKSGIVLEKTADPLTFTAAGQVITYTFAVSNPGTVPLGTVTVSDPTTTVPVYVSGDTNSDGYLDVDETWTYTATYEIQPADVTAGSVPNTATASATDPYNTPVQDTDEATVTYTPAAIALVKSASPQTYTTAGQVITYTFAVSNAGTVPLGTVTVSDPTTTVPVYVSGDANSDGYLDVDETWTYTASYTIQPGDVAAGSVLNTAVASAVDPYNTPVQDTDEETVTYTPAAIALVKSASPQTYTAAGQVITYTFAVGNPGTVPLGTVTVSDPTTTTPVYVSGDTNSDGYLDVDETWTYTASYTIQPGDVAAGSVLNTAVASAVDPYNTPVQDSDEATVTYTPAAIALVKSASPQTYTAAGQVITYTFAVSNPGTVPLGTVTVSDPTTTTPVYVSGDTNTDGYLDVDETWTYTAGYTIQPADVTAGSVPNTATANATDPYNAPVQDSDDETVTYAPAAIALVKTASPQIYSAAGQTITYTFLVTNPGTVPLGTVTVSDPTTTVPVYVSGDTNSDGYLDVDETWTYTASYTIQPADVTAGSVPNTATASATDPYNAPVQDSDDETVTYAPAAIALVKTASPQIYSAAGQTITYTFLVTNPGTVPLSAVQLVDSKTTPPAYVGGDTNNDGTLDVDETWTYTATYQITAADVTAGSVPNTAKVNGKDPYDRTVQDTDDEEVRYEPSQTFSIGNRVFLDAGAGGGSPNNGIQDGAEPGIEGVILNLYQADGVGAPTGLVLQSTTTDVGGWYRFDGLDAGTYVVVVDVESSFASLIGLQSSSGASTDFTLADDLLDHGLDMPLGTDSVLPGGIASSAVTVGMQLQPTGEAIFGTGAGANGPEGDASDNLVVDFGFYPPPPTAVELAYFQIEIAADGLAQLAWVTLVERDTLGFRLERFWPGEGWWPLFDGVIPAEGDGVRPQFYSFPDPTPFEADAVAYRLIEVDLAGEEHPVAELHADLRSGDVNVFQ